MAKVVDFLYNEPSKQHIVIIKDKNVGLFGSKIATKQKEKIESVLNKKYIKLFFGIRLLY